MSFGPDWYSWTEEKVPGSSAPRVGPLRKPVKRCTFLSRLKHDFHKTRLTAVQGVKCLLALGQGHFLPDGAFLRGHPAAVDSSLVLTIGIAALAVFFAGLVALAVDAGNADRLRRLWENRGLRVIGEYSYGIYVFHPLLLAATIAWLAPSAYLPPFLAKPVVALWLLGISLVVAWLSYHLYEKHFLRLKRYFEYRKVPQIPALLPSQPASYTHA